MKKKTSQYPSGWRLNCDGSLLAENSFDDLAKKMSANKEQFNRCKQDISIIKAEIRKRTVWA